MIDQDATPEVSPEIKPCPFCGHSDTFIPYVNPNSFFNDQYRVECGYCGAMSGSGYRAEKAIERWNMRNDTPDCRSEEIEDDNA